MEAGSDISTGGLRKHWGIMRRILASKMQITDVLPGQVHGFA